MSTIDTLRLYNSNLARSQSIIANDPTVKRQTALFNSTVATIKTSKDFVNNHQVYAYAMTAYGLSDMVYAKAFMQKIMDGGVLSSNSMANKLSDTRFRAFAAAFNFGDKGTTATSDKSVNARSVTKFMEQKMEDQAGAADAGAKLALYFQRMAPSVTNGYQILADKALSQFVQTTFNLPVVRSANALDAAASTIEKKIKINDLKDPSKVANLVARFAAAWDATNNNSGNNSAVQIISNSTTGVLGFNNGLLLRIQRAYTTR